MSSFFTAIKSQYKCPILIEVFCDHPVAMLSYFLQFSPVQSLSHVWLFETQWTAAHQASLSITNSQSLPKIISIESVMPCSHLILCHPLVPLPSIFPSIRLFSNESALPIRWPKYWSFSFNINEHLGLISFKMYWQEAPPLPPRGCGAVGVTSVSRNPRWRRSCWDMLAVIASVPTLVLSSVSEMLFLWEPQPKKRWRGSGVRTLVQTVLCRPISASTAGLFPWRCPFATVALVLPWVQESLFLACRPFWSLGALSLIWNLWSPCVWGQHWSTQPNLHLSSLSCITHGMGSDTWCGI